MAANELSDVAVKVFGAQTVEGSMCALFNMDQKDSTR